MRFAIGLAGPRRWRVVGVFGVVVGVWLVCCGLAWAGSVGWSVRAVAEPSSFSAADKVKCEVEDACDRYQLLLFNAGDEASNATVGDAGEAVTITDKLPAGLTTIQEPESGTGDKHASWHCTQGTTVTCSLLREVENEETGEIEEVPASVPAGSYAPFLDIIISAPGQHASGVLRNEVTASGGGSVPFTAVGESEIGKTPAFEVNEFAFEPLTLGGGALELQAGGHPWEQTTSLGIPVGDAPVKNGGVQHLFSPPRNIKDVAVELPAGIVGNPQATEQCQEAVLRNDDCPAGSQVGVYGIVESATTEGEFGYTGQEPGGCCSAVYNMVPEHGYPAEFGFTFAKNIPVILYANVVHTSTGYRIRITTPGVPVANETVETTVTLFGDPGLFNGTGSETAFLSDPSDCQANTEGLSRLVDGTAKVPASRIELEAWGQPGRVVSKETTVYPELTQCDLLQFNPSLSFQPSSASEEGTTRVDEPSAYTTNLAIPQTTKYNELATPDLRDATVSLPAGVTINPPAGEGLAGCQAEGPEGINIGSDRIGPGGRDLGDPEATEFGNGHAGGNNSPYDDGFYHTAPGHCPEASEVGTVEAFTPLLPTRCGGETQPACKQGESPAPLQGHVFVAEPKCGETGQPECSEASASNGELFDLYLEVDGSGVIVKAPGTIEANPQTGQLTASFKENPQLPFSELLLHLRGGARAPLANPLTCGAAQTNSTLEPWSHPATPDALVSFSFTPTGCGSSIPFAPSFTAGTISPTAGGYSPFTLTFSRNDGEQNFAGITETMPAGLLGMLSNVTLCPEPRAQAGECSSASQIGTTTDTVGAGSEPLVREGEVYLTTGYDNAPFGLSIVAPANAGPFHLGNVVVRAAITVNPATGAVTVTSAQLPQSKDGVPFRIRTVNVNINLNQFIFNPTNCEPKQITATITATQHASANLASPFQATGCQNLPFKPVFAESTQGKTSKLDGASLTVTVTKQPGEANIRRTDVQLPLQLPSRLTTLQKACLAAQFNTNPAGCPEGSDVGTATASTPVLNTPLTGPAYLVANGAEFPDLEFVLQGEGVTIILDGKTDIKKGITYSNFETVPDAPINTFQATFPEGPHSVLAANSNLCNPTETVTIVKHTTRRIHGHLHHITTKTKKTIPITLTSPTILEGQNGIIIKQNTHITTTECPTTKPTPKPKPKHKKKKKT